MERFPEMSPTRWRRLVEQARALGRRLLGEDGLRPIVAAAGALDAANRANARAGDAWMSVRNAMGAVFGRSITIILLASAGIGYGWVRFHESGRPSSNLVATAPETGRPLQETPVTGLGWWPDDILTGEARREGVMAVRSGHAAPLMVSRDGHAGDELLQASSDMVLRLAADVVTGDRVAGGPPGFGGLALRRLQAILGAQIAGARPDRGRYSLAIGPNLTVSGPRPPAIAADGRIIIRGDSEVVAQFGQTQASRAPLWRTIFSPPPREANSSLYFVPLLNAVLVTPGAQVTGPAGAQSVGWPIVRRLEPVTDEITAFAPFTTSNHVAYGTATGQLTVASLPWDEAQERTTFLAGQPYPDGPAAIVRIATRSNLDDRALAPLVAMLDAAGRVTLVWRGGSDRLVFVPVQFGEDPQARPAIVDIRLAADGSTLAVLTLDGRVFLAGSSRDRMSELMYDFSRTTSGSPPAIQPVHLLFQPGDRVPVALNGDVWAGALGALSASLSRRSDGPQTHVIQDFAADLGARASNPRDRGFLISRQPIPPSMLDALAHELLPNGTMAAIPSPTRLREIHFSDAACLLTTTSIALNDDGSMLLTGYASGHVSVTPLRTSDEPTHFLRGHGEAVLEVSAAAGRAARVATRDAVSTVRLSDAAPLGLFASWRQSTARCPANLEPAIKRERIGLPAGTDPSAEGRPAPRPPPPPGSIVVYPHVSRASPPSITASALGLDRIAFGTPEQSSAQTSGGEQPRFVFDVQALDRVAAPTSVKPISANQIRFCNLSDRAAAEVLQNRLLSIDRTNAFVLVPINSLPNCRRVKPGTLELWYADAALPRPATAN